MGDGRWAMGDCGGGVQEWAIDSQKDTTNSVHSPATLVRWKKRDGV